MMHLQSWQMILALVFKVLPQLCLFCPVLTNPSPRVDDTHEEISNEVADVA